VMLPSQEGLRVLIVDDQELSRMVIRKQLESLKVEVWEATSADDARSLLADLVRLNLLPHLGILEWRMKGEDGVDLCRSIRANPATAKMPLILSSYAAAGGDAHKAREEGFDAYLVKPVPVEILAGTLYLVRKKDEPGEHNLITQYLVREMGLKLMLESKPKDLVCLEVDWTDFHPRILLAEDNEVNQMVGIRMLENLGCVVTLAPDGLMALKLATKESFDLILMDCLMPEMDGYEAAAAIRMREHETGKHVPIVACTANASQHELQKCLTAGMDDLLTKPYKPENLKTIVEKWVVYRGSGRA
jgi:CheY-like chemotaxis protein